MKQTKKKKKKTFLDFLPVVCEVFVINIIR